LRFTGDRVELASIDFTFEIDRIGAMNFQLRIKVDTTDSGRAEVGRNSRFYTLGIYIFIRPVPLNEIDVHLSLVGVNLTKSDRAA
jgi:hypothetical protein